MKIHKMSYSNAENYETDGESCKVLGYTYFLRDAFQSEYFYCICMYIREDIWLLTKKTGDGMKAWAGSFQDMMTIICGVRI